MGAEVESIGGVAVQIVGNYAPLLADLEASVAIAAQAGNDIAEGLNKAASAVDSMASSTAGAAAGVGELDGQLEALYAQGLSIAEALEKINGSTVAVAEGLAESGAAAAGAAEQLKLFDDAASVPFADAAGQLNLFATELEAIGPAAQAAAAGEHQFSEGAQEVIDKQKQAEKAVEEAAAALREIYAAYKEGAVSAATLARAQEELAAATAKVGEASEHAHPHTHSLLTTLLEFAGIELSIEALKEFAQEVFKVAAEEERAAESFGFMAHNMAEGVERLEELKEHAQDLAVPFDSVVSASQKMQFFKFTTEEADKAIRAASDAAKASGGSFDSMSSSIANIAFAGNAMPRTLRAIGVSMEDLAEVMQVRTDQVQKAFKGMSESARLDALVESMKSTAGATEAFANDTTSNLTRLSNQWHFAMADIGAAITPAAMEALPSLAMAIRGVLTAGTLVVVAIKVLVDSIVGLTSAALEAVKGLGTTWFDVMTGQFSAAATAASDALGNIRTVGKYTWSSIVSDAQAGSELINKLWDEQAKSAEKSAESQTKASDGSAAAAARAALAAIASAKAMKQQQEELATFAKAAETLWNKIPDGYEEYVAKLAEGGQTAKAMLSQVEAAINKANTLAESMSGAPLKAMQAWADKLETTKAALKDFVAADDWNKTAQAVSLLADKYSAEFGKMDAATLDWVNSALAAARDVPAALDKIRPEKLLSTWLEQQEKLDESTRKLGQHFTDVSAKWSHAVQVEMIPITATLSQRLAGVDVTLQGIAKSSAGAFNTSQVGQYLDMVKAMNAEGMKTIQQVESQIKTHEKLLEVMTAMGQPLKERLDLQTKIYQEEITAAELAGRSATAQIVGLQNVKIAQQALYDETHMLGDLYVSVTNDILKGFDELGKSVADAIVDGTKLGDAFVATGKKIGKAILEDIIGTYFKALKDEILKSTGLLDGLTHSLAKFFGVQKTATDAASSITDDAAGPVTAGIKGSGAAGAAGGTSTLGIVGAVASIGQLISSIVGNFQMAKLETTMNAVEHNTRFLEIIFQKFAEADEWQRHKAILEALGNIFTRLGEVGVGVARAVADSGAEVSDTFRREINRTERRPGDRGELPAPPPYTFSGGDSIADSILNSIIRGGGPSAAAVGIPHMADGGPVAGDGLRYLHDGEFVVPRASVPQLEAMSSPATARTASVSINSGANTFHIYEAANPRETARQVAEYLKILSPRFAAYGQ